MSNTSTADAVAGTALHLGVVCVRRRRGAPSSGGPTRPAGLARRLRRQTGGAMTLYLWHIPRHRGRRVHPARRRFRRVRRARTGVLGPACATRLLVFAVVHWRPRSGCSPPLEHRKLPWWDASVGATSVRLRTAAGCADMRRGASRWSGWRRNGLAGSEGWSTLGFFLAAGGGCAGVSRGRSVGFIGVTPSLTVKPVNTRLAEELARTRGPGGRRKCGCSTRVRPLPFIARLPQGGHRQPRRRPAPHPRGAPRITCENSTTGAPPYWPPIEEQGKLTAELREALFLLG